MSHSKTNSVCPGIRGKTCGRALVDDEAMCPSCNRAAQSFWKQAAGIVVAVAVPLATVAAFVISGGKIKPKA
jgi:RNA polymerase subunit RPABC4/transcription elongation factor Spt4